MKICTILLLVLPNYTVRLKDTDSYTINITDISQCHEQVYPITVSQVSLKIVNKTLLVTGTLTTLEDLSSPLQASLKVEKNELGLWIDVPCFKRLGSCIYEDLCEFGKPINDPCPKVFMDNEVPCRCPIPQGTYTIGPMFHLPTGRYFQHAHIFTGKYWAKITVEHYKQTLSCYEVYFNIKRVQNEILPSIKMI